MIDRDLMQRAAAIRLVLFDVDGVLTDGSLFIGDDGQEYKAFNSKDGLGIRMLQDSGVEVGIITGRTSDVVRHRMKNLGVTHLHQGQQHKLPAYEKLLAELGLEPEQTAYVGDDVVDLPVLRRVGLAVVVADAHPLAKRHAHWETQYPGGRGAAREVCELIMEAQGTLDQQTEAYLV